MRSWPHDLAGLGSGRLGSPLSIVCASKNQTSRGWKAQEQGISIHPCTHPRDTAVQCLVRHEPAGVTEEFKEGIVETVWAELKGSAREVKDLSGASNRGERSCLWT